MIVKTAELKRLEALYEQNGNQLVFLYGKKDSEKSNLMKEFIKDKRFFFYHARRASEKAQLAMMGDEIARQYGVHLQEQTYREYFKRVKSNGPSKLVIVIQEAHHIMKKDETFWEAIVELKERKLYPGPVMIILTSSSIVWAEQTVLAEHSKMKQAFSDVHKMTDWSFLDVVRAFPEMSVSDTVSLYGVLGGVPGYLSRWNRKKNFKQNICDLVLTEGGYLYEAAENIISAELRELAVYNTILSTIASGKDKLNDLYEETGFSRAKISVYMKNLAQFDIIEKQQSVETGGMDQAKKGVYRISDTFVNFWYRFVYPHLSDLQILSASDFYDKYIAKNLDAYLNRYFIEVCKEYLSLLNQMKRLPIDISKMGSWIGKNGNIDIIAKSTDRRMIVGLCNWEKLVMTVDMLEELKKTMALARVSADHIYLFSAKAFDPQLVQLAKEDATLELIDMREL
ncbi:ATP-binding protein [Agathobacter ruminis]|uniref:ATPase n=1 Tax=Agathobacter ruminis TaxID=1712665 RepID=A0A2G3E3Q3_9FIRM|nr:ATP-binding protein [Agathobacter ruminis]MDC7302655.1 ATP-binding protein [Agathobacter ruminis]PHU37785.1 ATPase [Agathobacter ruminis]